MRTKKVILTDDGLDRREAGYYSTPTYVAEFMTKAMFRINPRGRFLLDPSVGEEEMISHIPNGKVQIDGIDIHQHCEYKHCNFIKDDFIDIYRKKRQALMFNEKIDLKYDYYLCNPPYNCHELSYIQDNKKVLAKAFPKIGTDNMYSMFVSAMVDAAKEGALIAFICPDGILTGRHYLPLREQILANCSIHYVVLCPNDVFSKQKSKARTCIMVLQKGKEFQGKVKLLNRPSNRKELEAKLKQSAFAETRLDSIISKSGDKGFEFIIGIPGDIQQLMSCPRLGYKFPCVTGISTGNDSNYTSAEMKKGFTVPIFRNPYMRRFYSLPDGYLTDSYLSIGKKNFMVRNKKFLLKEGIACSQIGVAFSACLMPKGSVWGVNAAIFCAKKDTWWMLSYLNSSLVTYILRAVLHRSNSMSSGYVSLIPLVPISSKAKQKLEVIAKVAYKNRTEPKNMAPVIQQIDSILFKELKLSRSTEKEILHFTTHLLKRL